MEVTDFEIGLLDVTFMFNMLKSFQLKYLKTRI